MLIAVVMPDAWDRAASGPSQCATTVSDCTAVYTYLEAAQLPMQWQPNADYQLNEIANNLNGVTPVSPTLDITPENWYLSK